LFYCLVAGSQAAQRERVVVVVEEEEEIYRKEKGETQPHADALTALG
jgi:hypothetical protein